jgi:hypothetical protein
MLQGHLHNYTCARMPVFSRFYQAFYDYESLDLSSTVSFKISFGSFP